MKTRRASANLVWFDQESKNDCRQYWYLQYFSLAGHFSQLSSSWLFVFAVDPPKSCSCDWCPLTLLSCLTESQRPILYISWSSIHSCRSLFMISAIIYCELYKLLLVWFNTQYSILNLSMQWDLAVAESKFCFLEIKLEDFETKLLNFFWSLQNDDFSSLIQNWSFNS